MSLWRATLSTDVSKRKNSQEKLTELNHTASSKISMSGLPLVPSRSTSVHLKSVTYFTTYLMFNSFKRNEKTFFIVVFFVLKYL